LHQSKSALEIRISEGFEIAFLGAVRNTRDDTMLVLHLSRPTLQFPQAHPILGCATLGNCLMFFDGLSSWLRILGLARYLLDAQDLRWRTKKALCGSRFDVKNHFESSASLM
jgi:hypothetical protein